MSWIPYACDLSKKEWSPVGVSELHRLVSIHSDELIIRSSRIRVFRYSLSVSADMNMSKVRSNCSARQSWPFLAKLSSSTSSFSPWYTAGVFYGASFMIVDACGFTSGLLLLGGLMLCCSSIFWGIVRCLLRKEATRGCEKGLNYIRRRATFIFQALTHKFCLYSSGNSHLWWWLVHHAQEWAPSCKMHCRCSADLTNKVTIRHSTDSFAACPA